MEYGSKAMKRLMDVIEQKGKRMMNKSMDKSIKQNCQLEAYSEVPKPERPKSEHIEYEELYRIACVVTRLLDKPYYGLQSWNQALEDNMCSLLGLWENMYEGDK